MTATDTATGTIIDDDGETTVTVTDASVDEGRLAHVHGDAEQGGVEAD